MPTTERGIVFTNDLDGVHFKAPIPLKKIIDLARGNFVIPAENRSVGEYLPAESCLEVLLSRWSVFFHQVRPVEKEALKGLVFFEQVAETHKRQLQFAALSGREKDKHPMTEARLQQAGHMQYFGRLFLNQGRSSSAWKESVVRQLVQEGLNVVHIDDDLRSALCIARIDGQSGSEAKVQVYLMRNLSNQPWLLKRSKITIPDNLVFVSSFREAANDFAQRLERGEL